MADLPADMGAGIWRLRLPTPWPVGAVNVYVIADEPLTLIDTGQCDHQAREALVSGLAHLGLAVPDIERVIITHQHVDHCGLAGWIADQGKVEVAAPTTLVDWLEHHPKGIEADDAWGERLMDRHGIQSDSGARHVFTVDETYVVPVQVTRPLADGATLAFSGRTLSVAHRPGHSPSDTVLIDAERRVMFSGDHLVGWPVTSLLSAPLAGSDPDLRPRLLERYRASFAATRQLDLAVVLPGHGDPVTDHRAAIDDRIARYDAMQARVAAAVSAAPASAAEIMLRVRPGLPEDIQYYVLSEVLGHLDGLIAAGTVAELDEGEQTRFVRVGG